jgi:hypothetical protein
VKLQEAVFLFVGVAEDGAFGQALGLVTGGKISECGENGVHDSPPGTLVGATTLSSHGTKVLVWAHDASFTH